MRKSLLVLKVSSSLSYKCESCLAVAVVLHISQNLRHVTVLPAKGFREFVKVKIGSRRLSCRMFFYSILFFTFLLRFMFVLTAVDTIDGETKCSTLGAMLAKGVNKAITVLLGGALGVGAHRLASFTWDKL